MAFFTSEDEEEDFIEDKIEEMKTKQSSPYTSFLESKPIFATYYQQDIVDSSYDKGLENVEANFGENSPVKYNAIKDLPLYRIEEIYPSLEAGEFGLETVFESECTVVPNTIKPRPDDYFVINALGTNYLFKVTSVTPGSFKTNPFYNVQFKFDTSQSAEIFEQDTTGKYQFIFSHIGTENKNIILEEDFVTLDKLRKVYSRLADVFIQYFFHERYNTFTSLYKNYNLCDRNLNQFIIRSKIFQNDKNYLQNIMAADSIVLNNDFINNYKNSLFYAIELQSMDNINNIYTEDGFSINGYIENIIDPQSVFTYYGEAFHTVSHKLNPQSGEELLDYFPSTIITHLIGDIRYSEEFFIENIIMEFIIDGDTELTSDRLDKLFIKEFSKDSFSYIFIPLILYIMKKKIKGLI